MKNERLRETWRVSGWRSGRRGTLFCASSLGSCGFFCYRALAYVGEETGRAGAQQENSSVSGNLLGSLWVYEDSGISAYSVRAPSCCWAYEEKKKRRMRMTRKRRKSQMRSLMRRMKMKTCWSCGTSANPSPAPAPPWPQLEMGWRSFQFLRWLWQLVRVFEGWNLTLKTDSLKVYLASPRRPCVRLAQRAGSLGLGRAGAEFARHILLSGCCLVQDDRLLAHRMERRPQARSGG